MPNAIVASDITQVEPVDEQALAVDGWSSPRSLMSSCPRPCASCAISMRDSASTMNVSTNSTRPSAISDARCTGSAASLNSLASAEAIELPGANSDALILYALPMTNVTAIVSPSARPRPSMMPPITPTFVYGSTTFQTTSHVVQPMP